jgi:DNA-binding NarL/FixJ family response regulator
VAVVWIHSRAKLIREALATYLERVGYEVQTAPRTSEQVTIAIWDLRDEKPPYPRPPAVPTLALLDGTNSDKLMILSVGYRGYLTGEEDPVTVKKAIETVLAGQLWAERSVLSQLVSNREVPSLTDREHQVLSLVIDGLTNKQIAQRLNIAEKTVKVYVSGVLAKLKAKGRTDLIMRYKLKNTDF